MKNARSIIILTVFIFISITNSVEVLEERKLDELQKLGESNLLNDESILKVSSKVNKDINKYQFLLHIQIDKWNRIIELAKIEKVYHNVYRR